MPFFIIFNHPLIRNRNDRAAAVRVEGRMWALINGVYLSVVLRAFIAGPLVLSYPDLHVLDARVLVTLHNRIIQIMHCLSPTASFF